MENTEFQNLISEYFTAEEIKKLGQDLISIIGFKLLGKAVNNLQKQERTDFQKLLKENKITEAIDLLKNKFSKEELNLFAVSAINEIRQESNLNTNQNG